MLVTRRLLALLLVGSRLLLAQADAAAAAAVRTGFLAQTIPVAGHEHRYVLYVPPGYCTDRRWPLLVFLNGAGECGTDGWKQVAVGLGPAIMHDVAAWPFLVLFPQKPDRESAWEDHDAMVMAMLAKVQKDYAVDDTQLFLTGLSQGGHGTWVLGARHAELWAAIAPICGYGEPRAIAPALKAMPIWCFHGEDDKAVPVKQSKDLCAEVERAGGHAELTLLPGTGHNSWDKAYRESLLAEWLLTAVSDRIGAGYIAHLDAITVAQIEIRKDWRTDAGVAFRGTTIVALELAREGLSFCVVTEYRDPKSSSPNPEPRKGKLEKREGRDLLLRQLRGLQAGAVFRLPTAIQPATPGGPVMSTAHYAVDVALDGKPGSWRFQRDVPELADTDPQFATQVRAIAEFVQAIEALR